MPNNFKILKNLDTYSFHSSSFTSIYLAQISYYSKVYGYFKSIE